MLKIAVYYSDCYILLDLDKYIDDYKRRTHTEIVLDKYFSND